MSENKTKEHEPLWLSITVLGVVCLVAALFLGYAYTLTKDRIEKQGKADLNEKLGQVFSGATEFKQGEGYFIAYHGQDILGYAAIAESSGYSSIIKIVVGMDLNKNITGIRILEQAETPGLGTEAANPLFYNQFSGLFSQDVGLKKYGGKIDAITGATITSKAVTGGVRSILINKLEKLVENNKQEKGDLK